VKQAFVSRILFAEP